MIFLEKQIRKLSTISNKEYGHIIPTSYETFSTRVRRFSIRHPKRPREVSAVIESDESYIAK